MPKCTLDISEVLSKDSILEYFIPSSYFSNIDVAFEYTNDINNQIIVEDFNSLPEMKTINLKFDQYYSYKGILHAKKEVVDILSIFFTEEEIEFEKKSIKHWNYNEEYLLRQVLKTRVKEKFMKNSCPYIPELENYLTKILNDFNDLNNSNEQSHEYNSQIRLNNTIIEAFKEKEIFFPIESIENFYELKKKKGSDKEIKRVSEYFNNEILEILSQYYFYNFSQYIVQCKHEIHKMKTLKSSNDYQQVYDGFINTFAIAEYISSNFDQAFQNTYSKLKSNFINNLYILTHNDSSVDHDQILDSFESNNFEFDEYISKYLDIDIAYTVSINSKNLHNITGENFSDLQNEYFKMFDESDLNLLLPCSILFSYHEQVINEFREKTPYILKFKDNNPFYFSPKLLDIILDITYRINENNIDIDIIFDQKRSKRKLYEDFQKLLVEHIDKKENNLVLLKSMFLSLVKVSQAYPNHKEDKNKVSFFNSIC